MTLDLKKIKKIFLSSLIGMSILTSISTTFASPNNMLSPLSSKNVSTYAYTPYSTAFKNINNSNIIYMEATGYSQYDSGCNAYTATGDYVKYGIAAVDPDVISLGTNLYVDGYGYAVAADTGGAIVGQRIDLAFDSHQEALNWGRQYVNVYIQA